ncbi:MAG: hypothetical protein ACHQFW_08920, partial [Chitinophagales bacterium]
MKKILLILAILTLSELVVSQNQNINWFFGDSVIIKFDGGGIFPSYVSGHAHEASCSVSDPIGNLLFYSNGKDVWDKNYILMPNTGLDIGQFNPNLGSSITQGIVTFLDPGDSSKYYLFQICYCCFKYSKINMNLNGGLGDVEEKDLLLLADTIMEKLQVIKHGNGRDWWVIIHEKSSDFSSEMTNKFYKFLVTIDGIEGPFVQEVGQLIGYQTNVGQMIAANDGSKIALTGTNFVEIFNFNRCTGELEKYYLINNLSPPQFVSYGCSFSQDGSKLYVSNDGTHSILYQYCLDCPD